MVANLQRTLRTPYISILTVSKNSEKTIQETLDGIRGQTFCDFEFIVIDGKSTDSTNQILEANLDIITTLISEEDEGLYYAMNKGLALCRGYYIGIINADDIYQADALERVYQEALRLKQPTIFYSPMRVIGTNQIIDVSHEELDQRMIPHPSCFVPREFYVNFGKFNTSFRVAADYELMIRFKKLKLPFKKISEPLVCYRNGGYSSNNVSKSILESIQIQHSYGNTLRCTIYPKYFFILFKTIINKRLPLLKFRSGIIK